MKMRSVRSKDIEFDVSAEDAPTLGTPVQLTVSMGEVKVERTYKVTRIRTSGDPEGTVIVQAKGEGE